jgi:alpha-L-fucosidase
VKYCTVFCRNLLLNVGPTHDGRIVPAFQERLLEMGAWLKINGEAIYDSIPWKFQNDTEDMMIWYTSSKDAKTVYAISFKAPTPGEDFVLKKAVVTESTEVSLLGYDEGPLEFTASPAGLNIKIPLIPFGELKYAWTFKLTYLA